MTSERENKSICDQSDKAFIGLKSGGYYSLQADKLGPVHGEVHVKYNHYNKALPIVDGQLTWDAVDEQMSFSFVFEGNFQLKMSPEKQKGVYVEQKDKVFLGLIGGTTYVVEVEEDEVAESKIEKTTYKAVVEEKKKNNKV